MNNAKLSRKIVKALCLLSCLLMCGCNDNSLRDSIVQSERKWYYVKDSRGFEDTSPGMFFLFRRDGIALNGNEVWVDTSEWTLKDSTLLLTQNIRGRENIREFKILRADSDTLAFIANKWGVTVTYALGAE